jgi:succinate dehydrogenase / fumarate reductase cytochrome b subunit
MAILSFYHTTIGKKIVMAVTGAIWVGYVLLHMFGNLKFFIGPESINAWAEFLRAFGAEVIGRSGVLWLARAVLLVSLILHITTAVQLKRLDRASRPVGYRQRRFLSADFAGRTMGWGGLFILVFVIYHVLHMTTGTVHPAFEEGQVYRNLVVGLGQPLVATFYILAMVVLALHLYHGTWSLLQTLGVNAFPKSAPLRRLGHLVAFVVAGGFMLVPLAILFGWVR